VRVTGLGPMASDREAEDRKKVFISYKSEEKALADQVCAALSGLGVSYFMDDGLTPDGHYSSQLDYQLSMAAAVLVLWTKASATSDFVYSEANKGNRRGVLVAALFDVSFDDLRVPFNTFQASDLSRWRNKKMPADDPEWQSILGTLGGKLGRPGLASLAKALDDPDEALKNSFVTAYPADPMVARLEQEIAARREFEENFQASGRAHRRLAKRHRQTAEGREEGLRDADRQDATGCRAPCPTKPRRGPRSQRRSPA
jgi:hypothetical protein